MASLVATPNPGVVGRPVVFVGEGFAATTKTVLEVAGTQSEIASDSDGSLGSDALADHAKVTLTATGNCGNGETVTLDARTYTMRTGTATLLPNEIRVGGSASATLDNIKAAVNRGSGEGSVYGLGTPRHETIIAGGKSATTIIFHARERGAVGNGFASTETLTNMSFGAANLSGGVVTSARPLVWLPDKPGRFVATANDGTNSASVAVQVFAG